MTFDLEYARQVIDAEAKGVAKMAGLVDKAFAQAAELIYSCKGSVIVTGIGKAGIVGQKISATLASTGTPSHFLHPAEAVHGDLGRLRKGDIVLVLSYGGETDEIIRLINIVKQLEIKLIGITATRDSRLAAHSDIVLCMGELDEASAADLRKMGVRRYNHNLETSQRFFASVVSTHHFDERVATLRAARAERG